MGYFTINTQQYTSGLLTYNTADIPGQRILFLITVPDLKGSEQLLLAGGASW